MEITGPHPKAAADCERILRSLPQWFGIESAIVDYVRDTERLPTFVLQDGGATVAFLTLKQHSQASWEVHCMAVEAEHRSQGYGRALLDHAEGWIARQSGRWLQVKTISADHPSPEYAQTRRFYEHMGFEPLEVFATLWSPANPCLLMIKRIEVE